MDAVLQEFLFLLSVRVQEGLVHRILEVSYSDVGHPRRLSGSEVSGFVGGG